MVKNYVVRKYVVMQYVVMQYVVMQYVLLQSRSIVVNDQPHIKRSLCRTQIALLGRLVKIQTQSSM